MDLLTGLKLSSLLVLASMLVLAIKKPEFLFSKLSNMEEKELPVEVVPQGISMEELKKWCLEQHEQRNKDRASEIELFYRRQLNGRLTTLEAHHTQAVTHIAEQYTAMRKDLAEIRRYIMDHK